MVAQTYIPLCIKMSNYEIQKEIENSGGDGDGGGFDFYLPKTSANTVAATSGKSLMKPHEFLSLLKKSFEVQSIEQRREAFLEKCCAENSEIDLDIRTFDITDDFSQQDRDSAINELCELFNRPELILKRSQKCSDASTTLEAALGTFRNLTDDLRAEDTNFDTCQTTSNIEVRRLRSPQGGR